MFNVAILWSQTSQMSYGILILVGRREYITWRPRKKFYCEDYNSIGLNAVICNSISVMSSGVPAVLSG